AGLGLGWRGSYLSQLIGLVGFVLYGGMKCIGRKKPDTADEKEKASFPFAPAYMVGCVAVLTLSCVLRRSLIL
ncbi:MAG: hypothetical protein ABF449_14155, partial [Ethanoligenens sp.]